MKHVSMKFHKETFKAMLDKLGDIESFAVTIDLNSLRFIVSDGQAEGPILFGRMAAKPVLRTDIND